MDYIDLESFKTETPEILEGDGGHTTEEVDEDEDYSEEDRPRK